MARAIIQAAGWTGDVQAQMQRMQERLALANNGTSQGLMEVYENMTEDEVFNTQWGKKYVSLWDKNLTGKTAAIRNRKLESLSNNERKYTSTFDRARVQLEEYLKERTAITFLVNHDRDTVFSLTDIKMLKAQRNGFQAQMLRKVKAGKKAQEELDAIWEINEKLKAAGEFEKANQEDEEDEEDRPRRNKKSKHHPSSSSSHSAHYRGDDYEEDDDNGFRGYEDDGFVTRG